MRARGVIALSVAMVLVSVSATGMLAPDPRTSKESAARDLYRTENRYRVPPAHRAESLRTRAAAGSASILGARGWSAGAVAPQSPGIMVCGGGPWYEGTPYDYQHHDDGQRRIGGHG